MTWPPTWEQLTALIVSLAGGYGWLLKRRDRAAELEKQNAALSAENTQLKADLATAMAEAEKTDRSHQEALEAKNMEITEWRRQVDRRDDRITTLEDRLYTGGGQP